MEMTADKSSRRAVCVAGRASGRRRCASSSTVPASSSFWRFAALRPERG